MPELRCQSYGATELRCQFTQPPISAPPRLRANQSETRTAGRGQATLRQAQGGRTCPRRSPQPLRNSRHQVHLLVKDRLDRYRATIAYSADDVVVLTTHSEQAGQHFRVRLCSGLAGGQSGKALLKLGTVLFALLPAPLPPGVSGDVAQIPQGPWGQDEACIHADSSSAHTSSNISVIDLEMYPCFSASSTRLPIKSLNSSQA